MMRQWAAGKRRTAPREAIIIKLAKECGVTPWQFEAECTARWWNWMIEYENAVSDGIKKR